MPNHFMHIVITTGLFVVAVENRDLMWMPMASLALWIGFVVAGGFRCDECGSVAKRSVEDGERADKAKKNGSDPE